MGYQDLSPHIINALIATEDVRFAEHSGIDAKALFRAVVKRGLLFQKNAGGGSTITQQLSKQLYSPSAENTLERLFQKPIEWVIAVKLERYYTKEEILSRGREDCCLHLLRMRPQGPQDRRSRHAGGHVQEPLALQPRAPR